MQVPKESRKSNTEGNVQSEIHEKAIDGHLNAGSPIYWVSKVAQW